MQINHINFNEWFASWFEEISEQKQAVMKRTEEGNRRLIERHGLGQKAEEIQYDVKILAAKMFFSQ